MAEVPLSQQDLDSIVYSVATEFIEYKAINGEIEDTTEEIIQNTVNDVAFIINSYMTNFNDTMNKIQLSKADLITTNIKEV
jgi:predicted nuclease of restriction endonuclease-like (RecB) superfamily